MPSGFSAAKVMPAYKHLYFIVFTMLFRKLWVDFDVKPQKYHPGADR